MYVIGSRGERLPFKPRDVAARVFNQVVKCVDFSPKLPWQVLRHVYQRDEYFRLWECYFSGLKHSVQVFFQEGGISLGPVVEAK